VGIKAEFEIELKECEILSVILWWRSEAKLSWWWHQRSHPKQAWVGRILVSNLHGGVCGWWRPLALRDAPKAPQQSRSKIPYACVLAGPRPMYVGPSTRYPKRASLASTYVCKKTLLSQNTRVLLEIFKVI
jgi:hypothetical protein